MYILLVIFICYAHIANAIVVGTPSGFVRGSSSSTYNRVTKFLAIPYANYPERFTKPEMVTPWTDVHNGTSYGKSCMQMPVPGLYPQENLSEDCLILDIYTPVDMSSANRYNANKTVMVWIHGGGFLSGNSEIFESSKLADQGDVVVVVIQYRLGVFGFLYTQDKTTTNVGLWDQRLALQWVQDNIQAYGGDKQKVTVFGESAGAISISCHMISPQVNGSLMQRGIMQSGSIFNGDKTLNSRDQAVDMIATKSARCNGTDNLKCLKDMPTLELVTNALTSGVTFWPATGDEYLPIDSLLLLENYSRYGAQGVKENISDLAKYDIMLGHNGNEGMAMLPFVFMAANWTDGLTATEFHDILRDYILSPLLANQTIADELMNELTVAYNQTNLTSSERTDEERLLKLAMDLIGDQVLKIPQVLLSMIHSDVRSLHSTISRRHTYYYVFDHKPEEPSPIDSGPAWLKTSANHADELQYFFSDGPYFTWKLSPAEEELSRALISYWTNFAKEGHPRTCDNVNRGATLWREFSSNAKNRHFLRFTTNEDKAEVGPRGEMADLWLKIFTDIAAAKY